MSCTGQVLHLDKGVKERTLCFSWKIIPGRFGRSIARLSLRGVNNQGTKLHTNTLPCATFPGACFTDLVFPTQVILSISLQQSNSDDSWPGGCVLHDALALHAAAIPGPGGVTACHGDLLVRGGQAQPAAGATLMAMMMNNK